jgi:hypothetical protein
MADVLQSVRTTTPRKSRRRWRHDISLPSHGSDVDTLWRFVAAHVEDGTREKPCPLGVKAWKHLVRCKRIRYRDRTATGLLPVKMPDRLSLGGTVAEWTSK